MLAYNFDGKRFDCGSKIGYLQAQVEFALEHDEVGDEFREYLEKLKLSNVANLRVAAG